MFFSQCKRKKNTFCFQSSYSAAKKIAFNCLVYADSCELFFCDERISEHHLNCVKMSKSLTFWQFVCEFPFYYRFLDDISYHTRWCVSLAKSSKTSKTSKQKNHHHHHHHFDLSNNRSKDNTWWCKAATLSIYSCFVFSRVFFLLFVFCRISFIAIIFDAVTINSFSVTRNFVSYLVRAIAIFAQVHYHFYELSSRFARVCFCAFFLFAF